MVSLGTKLLNLRQQQRLTQTEIADIINVSQNAYNKWGYIKIWKKSFI